MRIPPELNGARLSIVRTAELLPMDSGHLRRLIRRGIFPSPRRTGKGRPYFDYELLCEIADVLKRGVGRNGEEISFYRRKPRRPSQRTNGAKRQQQPIADEYVAAVAEGCRQLGIAEADLAPSRIAALLSAEFQGERPPLEQAIPTIARRLLEGQQ